MRKQGGLSFGRELRLLLRRRTLTFPLWVSISRARASGDEGAANGRSWKQIKWKEVAVGLFLPKNTRKSNFKWNQYWEKWPSYLQGRTNLFCTSWISCTGSSISSCYSKRSCTGPVTFRMPGHRVAENTPLALFLNQSVRYLCSGH